VRVTLTYRADLRLKVVECKTGNTVFLTDLELFVQLTDVDVEEYETRTGTIKVPLNDYKQLRSERLG
jgi:hypothetical protein